MTLADLLIGSNETRSRRVLRTHYMYEYYSKSLEKYISWMKEQIDKNKQGFVRVKRGDLALAMKKELEILMGDNYRDRTFNALFDIMRIVLFDEGIVAELGHYDGDRVFMLRYRTPNDCLIPSLAKLEKDMKGNMK